MIPESFNHGIRVPADRCTDVDSGLDDTQRSPPVDRGI